MKVVNAERFRRKPVLALVLRVLIESRFRSDFLLTLSCSSLLVLSAQIVTVFYLCNCCEKGEGGVWQAEPAPHRDGAHKADRASTNPY